MQLFLLNVYLELRVVGLWQMPSQVSLCNIYLNQFWWYGVHIFKWHGKTLKQYTPYLGTMMWTNFKVKMSYKYLYHVRRALWNSRAWPASWSLIRVLRCPDSDARQKPWHSLEVRTPQGHQWDSARWEETRPCLEHAADPVLRLLRWR